MIARNTCSPSREIAAHHHRNAQAWTRSTFIAWAAIQVPGTIDAETLDLAVDALETLQGRGQKVGVITHLPAMIERIAVQVRVEECGPGRSEIRGPIVIGTVWPAVDAVQQTPAR